MIDHKTVKIVADTGKVVDEGYAILFQIDEFSDDRQKVRGSFLFPTSKDEYSKYKDENWYPINDFAKGFDYISFDSGLKKLKVTAVDVNPWITSRIQ